MDIKNPEYHHQKVNVVLMRVTPRKVWICIVVTIVTLDIYW